MAHVDLALHPEGGEVPYDLWTDLSLLRAENEAIEEDSKVILLRNESLREELTELRRLRELLFQVNTPASRQAHIKSTRRS